MKTFYVTVSCKAILAETIKVEANSLEDAFRLFHQGNGEEWNPLEVVDTIEATSLVRIEDDDDTEYDRDELSGMFEETRQLVESRTGRSRQLGLTFYCASDSEST